MSIQALAWVFEQDIPSRAKNVLFALANHADHVTGHCFPSVATIMKEASCSRGGVFNFISLLRRNGFVDVRPRLRDDGGKRSSDYWLLFDRQPAGWISKFVEIEENSIEDYETDEIDGGGPHRGLVENSLETPPCVPGESAPWTSIIEPSDSNRQSPESIDGRALKAKAPQEFSFKARAIEQAKLQAAEEARKPKRIPVIEGSEPWKAWLRAGHPPTLVGIVEVNGKRHRGWSFDAEKCQGLYPRKQSTGPPPISPLMNSEDEKESVKQWS